MNKEDYIKIIKEKLYGTSQKIFLNQLEKYDQAKEQKLPPHTYNIGDSVTLRKGTLLHGTYKNIEGLQEIVSNGLISSWFIDGRLSKYPSSVGVWHLKQDYLLKEYINFYSGGTIAYRNMQGDLIKTDVIPYDRMKNIMTEIHDSNCFRWEMEQTKEARFMPSFVQNEVQIGIIFNGETPAVKELLKGDILSDFINDKDVKAFVNPDYYDEFIIERKYKNDFFTDRESAILFGIPSNFIEGILVGKKYENDWQMLNKIKSMIPNCYICNLDGKVICI